VTGKADDLEEIAMSKPSDSKSKREAGVDRRRFFTMGGSAVVAAASAPLTSGEALADNESQADRLKARYKETDHVKDFYRVNRY
jgi:hypothetical protein